MANKVSPSIFASDSQAMGRVGENILRCWQTALKMKVHRGTLPQDSARNDMVLQPDGKPADGTRGTPRSPIIDPSIIGTGFGVDVDPTGAVWFGNFGWGGVNPEPPQGSIVKLSPSGQTLSGPQGFSGGPNRAQATVSDAHGNIWIASYGNDSVYVFPEGDPDRSVGFSPVGCPPQPHLHGVDAGRLIDYGPPIRCRQR